MMWLSQDRSITVVSGHEACRRFPEMQVEGYGSMSPFPGTGNWKEAHRTGCVEGSTAGPSFAPALGPLLELLILGPDLSRWGIFWPLSYNFLFWEFLIFIDILVIWIYLIEIPQVGYRNGSCSEMPHPWDSHIYVRFWCHDPFPKVCRHIFIVF